MSDSRVVLVIGGHYAGDIALLLRELERRHIRAELREHAIKTGEQESEREYLALVEHWAEQESQFRDRLERKRKLDENIEKWIQQVHYIEKTPQAWQYDPKPEPVIYYAAPAAPLPWKTEYG